MIKHKLSGIKEKDAAQVENLLGKLIEVPRTEASDNANILETYRTSFDWTDHKALFKNLMFALAEYYARTTRCPRHRDTLNP
ncbi:MAG TPA: hypothetical protein PL188_05590 [Candidatus Cloacimonadota bacterium]|nr:hypothetical protein [Candidatus Cloacimonadota bacterium]